MANKFKMGTMEKCCFCHKSIKGFGNNPWPLEKREGARCCDKCNWKVIAARLNEANKK